MPYVEVWVDEAEVSCGGHCEQAAELKKRRDLTFELIVDGRLNEAVDLLLRGDLPDRSFPTKTAQAKYEAWSRGQLDGFAGPAAPENYFTSKMEDKADG